jgi:PiT family inorganic phosphate transporter
MFGLDTVALVTLVVALLASAVMSWVIGAGSSGATPFAPAVGANAISVMRAALVVGVFGFAGAVLQGGNVSQTVGGGLVHGVTLTPLAVIVALVTAAGLMLVGIRTGIPIATAFTVTGVVVGTGVALGGTPAWDTYREIAALWTLTPLVGGGIAYVVAAGLADERVPERCCVPALGALVGGLLAVVGFDVLGPPGEARSIAAVVAADLPLPEPGGRVLATLALGGLVAALLYWDLGRDERAGLRHFLLGLGALVAFSAGGSQVGLAVGPLLPLVDGLAVPAWAVLLGGGLGILVGSWTGAPRMIKSLAQDYSSLGPRRSIAALVPSFAIAQAAVLLGVPVSFNEIVVSAIVGSGAAVGDTGVSRRKLATTVGAWAGSLALAFLVGYGVFSLVA